MNNNDTNEQEVSISLLLIFRIIVKHILPILLATVVVGGAAFAVTKIFIKPKYRASAMVYVRANAQTGNTTTTSEMSVAKQLVTTYSIILETDRVLEEVYDNLDSQYKVSVTTIKNNLTEEAIENSEIFRINYVDTDPERAEKIVNAVAEIAPQKILDIVQTGAAQVVQYASTPKSPISPNALRNAAIAAAAAFVLSAAVFVMIALFDTSIRTSEDLSETFGLTVLGSIPTIMSEAESSDGEEPDDE
ncbi:MAG: hypothetical protein IJT49_03095 [Clostridia bacterium]|nr:hypothetical protein [Clostridia bacterium]